LKGIVRVRTLEETDDRKLMAAYDFKRTARWTLYTAGVIYLMLGALLASRPFFIDISPSVFMGTGMIIAGINYFVPYFSLKNNPMRPVWLMLFGVIDAIFGIIFISRIWLLLFSLTTIIGAWMILIALIRVYMARQIKGSGGFGWKHALAGVAVITLVGLLLLSNRGIAEFWGLLLTGASLIGVGCVTLMEGRVIYGER
jgi:uncharacterized membrane protein HdeD (DUF308 family)